MQLKKQALEIIKDLRKQVKEKEQLIKDYSLLAKMLPHELINPLNSILGFGELLGEPDLTEEERKEYCLIIKKSGKYLSESIKSISLGEITKEQIEKNSKVISLESIANESGNRQSYLLKEM
jgi:signal transduction histidine kinase